MKRHTIRFLICATVVILAGITSSICVVNYFVRFPVNEVVQTDGVSIPIIYGTDTDTIVFSPWEKYEAEEIHPYPAYRDSFQQGTYEIHNYGEVFINTCESVFSKMNVTTDDVLLSQLQSDILLSRFYLNQISGYRNGKEVILRAAADFTESTPDFSITMESANAKECSEEEKELAVQKVKNDLHGLMFNEDNELVQFLNAIKQVNTWYIVHDSAVLFSDNFNPDSYGIPVDESMTTDEIMNAMMKANELVSLQIVELSEDIVILARITGYGTTGLYYNIENSCYSGIAFNR